jgi:hypothetical protein
MMMVAMMIHSLYCLTLLEPPVSNYNLGLLGTKFSVLK